MKKNKKTKEEQTLKEENLNDVSGGGETIINERINKRMTKGNYNITGSNLNYEEMLNFVDRLNNSGELDYLKRK